MQTVNAQIKAGGHLHLHLPAALFGWVDGAVHLLLPFLTRAHRLLGNFLCNLHSASTSLSTDVQGNQGCLSTRTYPAAVTHYENESQWPNK